VSEEVRVSFELEAQEPPELVERFRTLHARIGRVLQASHTPGPAQGAQALERPTKRARRLAT